MARRVKTVTAKAGATAAARRILAEVAAATAAPTLSTDGWIVQQNEFLHLLFRVQGTNPTFRVRVWWYSDISGRWHQGHQVVVNSNDLVLVEVQGLSRIYLQVEGVLGTAPKLDAWIALARPV